ncbi:MAG: hypothetical protein ACRYG4_21070 [Janthinobacterium lividum]
MPVDRAGGFARGQGAAYDDALGRRESTVAKRAAETRSRRYDPAEARRRVVVAATCRLVRADCRSSAA